MKSNLVRLTARRTIITDTLVVANEFGRSHKNVLQRIRQLAEQGTLTELDFKPSEYTDPTGRKLPVYELTERGFLIAMPFIGGRKSQQGQVRLVDAFLALRRQVERHTKRQGQLDWQQARSAGRLVRHEETDTIQAFVRYAAAQGSEHAEHYFTNLTKATYKALFILEEGLKWKGLRDQLDACQLSDLSTAERIVRKSLLEGMRDGIHYKAIYQHAKAHLELLTGLVGKKIVTPFPVLPTSEAAA
jgi:Rha family phage regulatory protein